MLGTKRFGGSELRKVAVSSPCSGGSCNVETGVREGMIPARFGVIESESHKSGSDPLHTHLFELLKITMEESRDSFIFIAP